MSHEMHIHGEHETVFVINIFNVGLSLSGYTFFLQSDQTTTHTPPF